MIVLHNRSYSCFLDSTQTYSLFIHDYSIVIIREECSMIKWELARLLCKFVTFFFSSRQFTPSWLQGSGLPWGKLAYPLGWSARMRSVAAILEVARGDMTRPCCHSTHVICPSWVQYTFTMIQSGSFWETTQYMPYQGCENLLLCPVFSRGNLTDT